MLNTSPPVSVYAKPVAIPGKALALGLWVKGASDWGRVVYCLRDANDEMWISVGAKDQWNCDDVHSWSRFNFDGWRYVRFELPSHTEWDTFREYGTTWWRYAGGKPAGVGIVDLPLRLEKLIVERRTHVLYVNDIEPTRAEEKDVLLADMLAEYGKASDTTEAAVELNRKRMPLPETQPPLSDPIAEMQKHNELPPIRLSHVKQPDCGYDGTRCEVHFTEAKGAAQYQVWVAARPDGRGAVVMGRMAKPGGLVHNLRPATKLYLWVTYTEKLSEQARKARKTPRQSKPSNALVIDLVDAFAQK